MEADRFEHNFWSGGDINALHKAIEARGKNVAGMEGIFEAGYREFNRQRQHAASTADQVLEGSQRGMRVAQLRVLGGEMARVPADATAFAHRTNRIMVNIASFYEGPDDKPTREAWVAEFVAAIHQGDPAAYVNFLGDDGEGRVRAAYPGTTWDRLAVIKGRYDPTNLFRLNQNIPPA